MCYDEVEEGQGVALPHRHSDSELRFTLPMAAIASVSLMLAAAPTASAINTAEYTPDDYFIQLPAPIYNWKNSNKMLKFKVRKKQLGSGTDQAAMRLVD